MKRNLLLALLGVLICSMLQAQQKPITGTIKNFETKAGIENVSIVVKGTKKGTTTDAFGKFSINAAVGETLVFSLVGFQPEQHKIRANGELVAIMLAPSSNSSGEVVVIGGQIQSRRTTTAAVSSVMGRDIENLPSPSVDALLQGRVAGLNVQISSGEPGVAPSISVRGNSKINTSIGGANGANGTQVAQAQALSGPLYVIDGIPLNPDDISNTIDNTGTNYLAGISVNDIESVDVQKDAVATAAWGSRGANGVIYIKTKRGRSAKPEFRVNTYGGVTLQPQLLQTVTGAAERRQKFDLINQYNPTPAQLAGLPQILTDSLNPAFNNATDWQNLFYRTGNVKNVDLTMSAASDVVNYRLSMNYYDEKGIIEAFGYTRYSLRGNFDFKLSPKLNSQFIFGISKGDRQRGRKFANSDDNTPVSGSNQPSSFYRLTAFDSANFTGIYSKLRNKNINDQYNASLTLNYAIAPAFKYSFLGSGNVALSNKDYFQPSNIDQVQAANGTAQQSYAEADRGSFANYFLSNTLSFVKKLNTKNGHAHNIAISASQQFNSDVVNYSTISGYNVPSNDIQVVSGIPQANLSGYSNYQADGLLSFLGQAQYDYDGKYLLYASYRGDASSRFGNDTKWGYFPAVGAGWILSDEKFMKNTKKVVSFLKLRGSWGISGSQSPDFYAPYNVYNVSGTYNGASAIQPSYTNGLTKDNLTWAKTEQKDIGLEGQFFNNSINVSVDVYDKVSKDDYYNFALPFYTGFSTVNFNAHDLWVSNRGVDITLGSHNMPRKSAFQWNTQLTLSYNKNAIAKLPNNNRTFEITDSYGIRRIFAVGQPIYEMFQLKYQGVYNKQSEIPFDPLTGKNITYYKGSHTVVPGDPIWQDVNKIGDVWSDENNGNQYGDLQPTGNPNPKFTGGLVNDFTYKNFSLSIISVFTWKRDVVNTFFQQQVGNIVGGYSSSIYQFANSRIPDLSKLNYWTPARAAADPNYKADFPALNPLVKGYYQNIPMSSQFNEDGSYFKIKNVVLSYQLPQSFIKKTNFLNRAKVYCIMDNILTLKKGTMPDPEAVNQLGVYTGGLYPLPLKFTLGVDIQL